MDLYKKGGRDNWNSFFNLTYELYTCIYVHHDAVLIKQSEPVIANIETT